MLGKLFKKIGGKRTAPRKAAPLGMAKKAGRSASDRAKLRKSKQCEFC